MATRNNSTAQAIPNNIIVVCDVRSLWIDLYKKKHIKLHVLVAVEGNGGIHSSRYIGHYIYLMSVCMHNFYILFIETFSVPQP